MMFQRQIRRINSTILIFNQKYTNLVIETVSSRSQEAVGLMAQHIVTISLCSEPSSFWKAHLSFT